MGPLPGFSIAPFSSAKSWPRRSVTKGTAVWRAVLLRTMCLYRQFHNQLMCARCSSMEASSRRNAADGSRCGCKMPAAAIRRWPIVIASNSSGFQFHLLPLVAAATCGGARQLLQPTAGGHGTGHVCAAVRAASAVECGRYSVACLAPNSGMFHS